MKKKTNHLFPVLEMQTNVEIVVVPDVIYVDENDDDDVDDGDYYSMN